MGHGTPSFGGKHNKSHVLCRRCGKRSYHYQKQQCASCGYGKTTGMRSFNHQAKAHRRRTEGTGRMRFLKTLPRRFKNGFREGGVAKSQKHN